jgi:dTDP-4-amino-4,6-dideoxygalactose transaminase
MIKFFDIRRADKKLFSKNITDIKRIIKKTNFINGEEVKTFETNFSKFCNVRYSVGCNSGSDAIFLALKSLNLKKNSEVILPAQTYAATIFAVIRANLKPVLADIQSDNPTICPKSLKKKINNKTSAIIMVHLYGECCNIKEIKKLIKKKKIYLIEDAAQAHGAYDCSYSSKNIPFNKRSMVGSIGDLACFSFYPGKNLGAYGDGGMVTTNNYKYYNTLLKLRNLGGIKKYEHDLVGYNSRLDTIQAAVLNNKLTELKSNNKKRSDNAKIYMQNLSNKDVTLLKLSKACVYHQFVILTKKIGKISNALKKKKIQFGKYYPTPIHKLNAVKKIFKGEKYKNAEYFSKYGLGLPIDPNLDKSEILEICRIINNI